VAVADDGAGLPADFDLAAGAGLGLQIVRTLVESELSGRLSIRALTPGAEVTVLFPLDSKG
jgi:two-component sensor histidine kinase